MLTSKQYQALRTLQRGESTKIAPVTLRYLARQGLIARTGEHGAYLPSNSGHTALKELLKDSPHVTGAEYVRGMAGPAFEVRSLGDVLAPDRERIRNWSRS